MKAQVTKTQASVVVGTAAVCLVLSGCSGLNAGLPVMNNHDSGSEAELCRLLKSNSSWLDGAVAAESEWGLPLYISLAELNLTIGTETSRYIEPQDGDWEQYRITTERWDANVADVGTALDYLGWHARLAMERNQLTMEQAGQLYIASRLGHGGYLRNQVAPDLLLARQADQVEQRALQYRAQLRDCPRIRERAGSFFRWPW